MDAVEPSEPLHGSKEDHITSVNLVVSPSFDIIGHIPPELLELVVSYLDFTDVFRLRAVSRRWNDKLSDLRLQRLALTPWFSGLDETPGEGDAAAMETAIRKKASTFNNLRRGRPTATKHFELKCQHRHQCMLSEYAALIYSQNARCLVCDLRTGQWHAIRTLDGARMQQCGLFGSLVVFVSTTGTCYATDIATMITRTTASPSGDCLFLAARQGVVMVAVCDDSTLHLLIWDTATMAVQTVHLPTSAKMFTTPDALEYTGIQGLILPNTREAVMFSELGDMSGLSEIPATLLYTKVSLSTGMIIAEKEYELGDCSGFDVDLRPTGASGQYQVTICAGDNKLERFHETRCGVGFYDALTDTVSVRTFLASLPLNDGRYREEDRKEFGSLYDAATWEQTIISTPQIFRGGRFRGRLRMAAFLRPQHQAEFMKEVTEGATPSTEIPVYTADLARPERVVDTMLLSGNALLMKELLDDYGDRREKVHLLSFENDVNWESVEKVEPPEGLPLERT